MRKLSMITSYDNETFIQNFKAVLKDESGTTTVLVEREILPEFTVSEFNEKQLNIINMFNKLLVDQNQAEMTLDEKRYLIDPAGFYLKDRPGIENTNNIQALAGFKVEKVISYI